MTEKKIIEKDLGAEMPEDLITQSEAADLSGRSVAALNDLVRRGRLQSFARYGRNLVSRSDVLAFEPSQGGRPPKPKVEATNGQAEVSTFAEKPKRAAKKGGK